MSRFRLSVSLRAVAAVALAGATGLAYGQTITHVPGSPWVFPAAVNSNVVLLSHDEQRLFVANQGSNTISVLDLAASGVPTLRKISPTGSMPGGMALSEAGDRLFVATGSGIYSHAVAADGSLPVLGRVEPQFAHPMTGIQYAALPGGEFVFVNESAAQNFVTAWRVSPDGTLAWAGQYPTGGPGFMSGMFAAPRLLVHAGEFLFAGNRDGVSVFAIAPDGSLALVPASPFASPVPPAPPAPYAPPFAPALALDPSGTVLYSVLDGATAVRFLVADDGALIPDASFASGANYPVVSLAVHPSGRWLAGSFGTAGVRLWDTLAPGLPVLVFGGGAGLVWSADGSKLFQGVAGLESMRLRTYAFSSDVVPFQAFCRGLASSRNPLSANAIDGCSVKVDNVNRGAGGCSGSELASCAFDGAPSRTLGVGLADVLVTAVSATGDVRACTSYLVVADGSMPTLACPPTTVECTGWVTTATPRASCSQACGGTCSVTCQRATLLVDQSTTLTCIGRGGILASTCGATVTVVDTKPPAISVTASQTELWPPDGRFVPVDFTVDVADACDPYPYVWCEVSSSQPDPDAIFWWSDRQVSLRAKRAGEGPRAYTITCHATDRTWNTATATAQVIVPHDQR